MEFPNKQWFDNKLYKLENFYRKNNSVHYYLKKNDIVTALAEIRKGTSPFMRDECNRTALDLAILLFMRKFHESIFTSFITDFIYKNISDKSRMEFVYNKKGEIINYDEKMFYCYDDIMEQLKKNKKSNRNKMKSYNDDNIISCLLLQKKIKYSPLLVKYQDDSKYTSELEYKKKDLLFLFEEVLTTPMSKNIQVQLDELLRKMNALLFFIKTLSKNITLKKYSESVIKEEISNLSFPFLYNTTIHTLFRLFPLNHYNEKWNIKNPADSRRLINKILSKNLIGNEIIKFIGKSLFYFSDLLKIYNPNVFKQDPIISQYLLHMSFTLDNEYLFNLIINKNNVFDKIDIFHWDELIDSISPYKKMFKPYYKPLIYARLKKEFLDILEKDFYEYKKKDIKNHKKNNTSKYIKDDLNSTFRILKIYEDIFNASDYNELEKVLKKKILKLEDKKRKKKGEKTKI
ncbi:conserved Plasmodium protein, unknown function [Plasmodium gallinaceum]|uniref:Uncharacterized protein n=1 Tax=Plasmodium gallinaceum TaxID=5849 RepID=A0A1J1GQ65_PLAGA|nr:conserved Plasmodium protein, unknown function [Plasmodium gallinaceum]CRG94444.1 conserved Plasmodium protein, unknown function [Plasmodium gallinaceum]